MLKSSHVIPQTNPNDETITMMYLIFSYID